MPGPPPTPNERLRKRGGHGHGWRLSSATPESQRLPKGKIPSTPPRDLDAEGLKLWRRVRRIALDWISESDVEALLQACETLDDLVRVRELARASDHPTHWAMVRDARKSYLAQLSMLGFTPADRTRFNLGEVAQEEDPLGAFRRETA